MIVKIFDDQNNILWEHGSQNEQRHGIAAKDYILNGTQQSIIDTLSLALQQAEAEMETGKA